MATIFRRIGGRIIPIKATAELGGLAALSYPSVQALRGKKMSNKTKARFELGGLGLLGIATAGTTIPATSKAFKTIGRFIRMKYGKK